MKRILQHRSSGLYLRADGSFTSSSQKAAPVADFAAALRLCNDLQLRSTDYVYKFAPSEVSILPIFSAAIAAGARA